MHHDHAVVDLAEVAAPLALDACRVVAALPHPRLVHRANRLRMGVVGSDDLLAAVTEFFFIPLDRFEKSL
jgi:hypothetical protein